MAGMTRVTFSGSLSTTLYGPRRGRRCGVANSVMEEHLFLSHLPRSAADGWRLGDFGSFSARPSLSALRRISAHISSGAMPHSCHSTTKW